GVREIILPPVAIPWPDVQLLLGVTAPCIIRRNPESAATVAVIKRDVVLAEFVTVPGDQMRMMLILRETTAPSDSAAAAELPETEIDCHRHFEHVDARTARGDRVKLGSQWTQR